MLLEAELGTRRDGSGEDAPLEDLGERELRGGISERAFTRVGSVAGGSVLHEGLHEGGVELHAGRGVWNTTAETPRERAA